MHTTMKVTRSNRSCRSPFLVLLIATLAVVVHGQNVTNEPTVSPLVPTTPTVSPPVPTTPTVSPPVPTTTEVVPTAAPLTDSTDPPVIEPSTAPEDTDPPTMVPAPDSEPPSMLPVPTVAPSEATVPTEAPSEAPVAATDPPSEAPVPTARPTVSPVATEAPETDEPTTPVTEAPTTAPSIGATDPPTVAPTEGTEATDAPTKQPTVAPTDEDTKEPTDGTDAPKPVTSPPTQAPATGNQPTAPTPELVRVIPTLFQNLQITMTGVDPLDVSSFETWKQHHAEWYTNYYEEQPTFGIFNVNSNITFVSQDPPRKTTRRRLTWSRNLQDQQLNLVYSHVISYDKTTNAALETPADVIVQALSSDANRAEYTKQLQATDDDAFVDMTSMSAVTQEGKSDDGGLSTGAIVGIAVGGAAGVVLLGGVAYWAMTRGDGGYEKSAGDHPPSSLQLGGGDDVSTLNDPGKSLRAADSVGGYGDQSVATVDYDYSRAYGGGADSSVVSSVGGTLGSQTQATAAGAGMVEGSYSEEASFDGAYQDPNAGVKEVALEVWAPPGKLGVVIDTPNDGAPVVHAIKDSSVIADKLQVGDKLIAVDDENVEEMTAIKVSKLISRKSANPTRKLSIVRQVVE